MPQTIRNLRVSANCASCKENCCSQPYDWVYLTEEEVSCLATASGKQEQDFVVKRVNTANGTVFKALDLPCVFFDQGTGKCTVYPFRPLVCRLFPFYPDPMTGEAMFYPSQCGANLIFHPKNSKEGWELSQFDEDIRKWVRDIWREAFQRKE